MESDRIQNYDAGNPVKKQGRFSKPDESLQRVQQDYVLRHADACSRAIQSVQDRDAPASLRA